MKNIIVAVDYSDNAKQVVARAAGIAQQFGAVLKLVRVLDAAPYYGGGYGAVGSITPGVPEAGFVGMETGVPVLGNEMDHQRLIDTEIENLQRMATDLINQGVKAEYFFSEGDITDTILDEAAHTKADLIVMGFHEHGFLYSTFVGSTTEALLKKSKIPLLIVPEEKA